MADIGTEQRSKAQAVASRLWNSRWLLAAGIVAVLTVYVFAAGYVVLLACAVLLLAAAMLPAGVARQSAGDAAAIEASGLQHLSGEYLAAAVAD
ncbi:MAG: two-component sensor histidine kinase, partial [Mesorhizobium sp.]